MLLRLLVVTLTLFPLASAQETPPAEPASTPPTEAAPASAPATGPATPAAAPETAPNPVSQSPGIIVANRSSGFTVPVDPRVIQAIFRGMTLKTPGGHRTMVYLPPAKNPAFEFVMDKLLKWTEFTFERQSPLQETSAGRPLYKRTSSFNDVLVAVAGDPGGLGIVSGDTLLGEQIIVVWSGVP